MIDAIFLFLYCCIVNFTENTVQQNRGKQSVNGL